MDELQDIIRVLLVNESDEVDTLNSDYHDILVRDKNETFIGRFILDDVIIEDGLLHYRRYKKDGNDGVLSFIEQSRKNYLIRPFLMKGIVRVGFNDYEDNSEA